MAFDRLAQFNSDLQSGVDPGTILYGAPFYNEDLTRLLPGDENISRQDVAGLWWPGQAHATRFDPTYFQEDLTVNLFLERANSLLPGQYLRWLRGDPSLMTDGVPNSNVDRSNEFEALLESLLEDDEYMMWEIDTSHGNTDIDSKITMHTLTNYEKVTDRASLTNGSFGIRQGTARANHDATDAELSAVWRDGAVIRFAVTNRRVWGAALSYDDSLMPQQSPELIPSWCRIVSAGSAFTLNIVTGQDERRRNLVIDTPFNQFIDDATRVHFETREYIIESISEIDRQRTLRFSCYRVEDA